MRGAILAALLLSTLAVCPQSNQPDANLARWEQAQIYSSEGFRPVACFAGQVRVGGKRLTRHAFSLFAVDRDMKCCGALVKNGRTDQHGHFLVEPLPQGRYFAKFMSNGSEELISFAVVESYKQCDGTHLEVNFPKAGKGVIQEYVDINDSGEPCLENEPHCYRK